MELIGWLVLAAVLWVLFLKPAKKAMAPTPVPVVEPEPKQVPPLNVTASRLLLCEDNPAQMIEQRNALKAVSEALEVWIANPTYENKAAKIAATQELHNLLDDHYGTGGY